MMKRGLDITQRVSFAGLVVCFSSVVASGQEFPMDSTPVMTCGGVFTDSGGSTGSYGNNESFIKTFTPGVTGAHMVLDFVAFDVEDGGGSCADELRIYNGPTTGDPLIGSYCGSGVSSGPGQVISTHALGALTVEFLSGGATPSTGWTADIACLLYDESRDGDTGFPEPTPDLGVLPQGTFLVIGHIEGDPPNFDVWDPDDEYRLRIESGSIINRVRAIDQSTAGMFNRCFVRTRPPAASAWTMQELGEFPSPGPSVYEFGFAPFDVGGEEVSLGIYADRLSDFDYQAFVSIGPEMYSNHCNGDGGDQMGCTDCPCGNNAAAGLTGGCSHSFSSNGAGTRLLAAGSASVSLPAGSTTDLEFQAMRMPWPSTAVLFSGAGLAPQSMANPCFGMGVAESLAGPNAKDGLRCATAGLLRHGNRQSTPGGGIGGAAGPSRSWGGAASPNAGIAGQAGFAAGQTRYFQITHRDSATAQCMTGLNTSQAVEVTFTP